MKLDSNNMYAPHGKTRKHNATSRIIVGQKEGRKELPSQMKPPVNATQNLKPATAWIDCPKDKAKVKVITDKGRVTARQLAETVRALKDYVVNAVVDCRGTKCNEVCCLTCRGQEHAEKDARTAQVVYNDAVKRLRQWEGENK